MPGVRLAHPSLRGITYVVEDPFRPYTVPYLCQTCQTTHNMKSYHLELDGEGAVIVSTTVYERLQELGMAGLVLMNEVKEPPPITIGFAGMQVIPRIVEHKVQPAEE